MDSRSRSVGNDHEGEAEAVELTHITKRSDEKRLIRKEDIPHQPRAQYTRPSLLGGWLFEIISFCAALAVFAGVVTILAIYNGRPNPLWTGGITLNTVISVASVLFRVGLMVPVASCISQMTWIWLAKDRRPLYDVVRFDQASRSLYGSFQLLFSHHVQSFAFLGAVVSTFSLVIGPSFQQSLVFYSDSVVNMSAVSYVSYSSGFRNSNGIVVDWISSLPVLRVPRNMKAAVYNGLLASGAYALPSPPFSCPSGNCTWDPFPTLAIGVQCRDAPESYNLRCSKQSDGSESCAVVVIRDSDRYIHFSDKSETEENPDIVFHFAEARVHEELGLDPSLWIVPNGQRTDIDWIRVTNLHVLNETTISGPWTWSYIVRNSTIESRQCILYTCLHEISARVENGVYSETTQEVTRGTGFLQDSVLWNNYTYFPSDNKNGSIANITVTYAEQEALMSAIRAPFQEFLNEDLTSPGDLLNSNLSSGFGDYLRRTDMMTTLYLTPNLTETIQAVAHYMNVALRSMNTFADFQTSFSNDTKLSKDYISPKERIEGRVWIDLIHVRVRWPWLILPAVLMLLAFALLVSTILQTWDQRVVIWKENPLALLLFSKFDDHSKPETAYARHESEIKRAAEGLHAHLTTDTDVSDGDMKNTFHVRRKHNC